MGNLRKTVSANLGEGADKDLIDYFKKMNKKGINDSQLIKRAVRFYKDNCGKVAQLDEVDVANIINKEDIKVQIVDVVKELIGNGALMPAPKMVEQKPKRQYNKNKNNASKKDIKPAEGKVEIEDPIDAFVEQVKSGLDDGTGSSIKK